ncbi:hypothetical protein B0H67DRAFT_137047 [Lasiosphaeris hirsuta]|uniref:Beta-lactamase-related domain-containing protein n=1 Tax=Lasiosphaeris hirsuta TaxID=260670 RepID=A0AA40E3H4_9PEZI|nr:hypothetical protein B0H67DRAFT_137047 [Lasiosphaeris hirsuta]
MGKVAYHPLGDDETSGLSGYVQPVENGNILTLPVLGGKSGLSGDCGARGPMALLFSEVPVCTKAPQPQVVAAEALLLGFSSSSGICLVGPIPAPGLVRISRSWSGGPSRKSPLCCICDFLNRDFSLSQHKTGLPRRGAVPQALLANMLSPPPQTRHHAPLTPRRSPPSPLGPNSVGLFSQNCPFLGPAYHAPNVTISAAPLRAASAAFDAALTKAVAERQIDAAKTFYAIDVYSSDQFIYSRFYTALSSTNKTAVAVGPDTVFRIFSISKLITVYAFLARLGGGGGVTGMNL